MKTEETKKPPDHFITVQHVAERLSCTERYVSELIRGGALVAIKIGPRAIRVSENSLIEFIELQHIDPQSYFTPKEAPTKTSPPNVARSNWINR